MRRIIAFIAAVIVRLTPSSSCQPALVVAQQSRPRSKRRVRATRMTLLAMVVVVLASACRPGLNVYNPTEGQTVAGVITVDNEVTPDAQDGLDNVNANVNGTDIPLDANHDGQINTETLTNGQHTYTVNATNVAGTTTETRTINVQNPPIPGSICIVGDSITFMAFYPFGETEQAPADLVSTFGLGWRVENVINWLRDQVANRECQTSINALAFNDLNPRYVSSLTEQVKNQFIDTWNTPHAQACKVQVLPYWGSGLGTITPEDNAADPVARLAQEQLHVSNLTAFREWALQQDALREDLVTIDWQPFVEANPWVMDVDGIHLAWADYPQEDGTVFHTTMMEAAQIRQDFYWSGSNAACAEFIQQFEAAPELLVADPDQFALAG